MIATIFDGRSVDLVKFCTLPKCKGSWTWNTGSGCLLTALWASMGFRVDFQDALFYSGDEVYEADEMCVEFDQFVKNKNPGLPDRFERGTVIGRIISLTFTDHLVDLYDNQNEVEALNLLWTVIDLMPTTGAVEIEDVIKSLPCSIS